MKSSPLCTYEHTVEYYSLCLLSSSIAANTTPAYTWEYINTYSDIAIREMQRSGIPASITLAQGIHESSWGRGELSLNSNNHFGIKCKKEWQGPTFYIEDDDYVNGELIKSCFRAYGNVEDSYIDHTDFLVNNTRYQALFKLSSADYVAWAKGLKQCGYATDPNYANKLIKTIEEYQLDQYDASQVNSAPLLAISAPTVQNNVQYEAPQAIVPSNNITSQVPDLEAPTAFVLPDDYQRNSMQSTDNYFDQAEYLPYEPRVVQSTVPRMEENTNRPLAEEQVTQQTIVEEVNTPSTMQTAPVYAAPGYSVAPNPSYSGTTSSPIKQQRSSSQAQERKVPKFN